MKRKDYQKPTMTIVQLNQHGQLLTGSVQAMRNSYGEANKDTDIDEEEIIDGEWVWQ